MDPFANDPDQETNHLYKSEGGGIYTAGGSWVYNACHKKQPVNRNSLNPLSRRDYFEYRQDDERWYEREIIDERIYKKESILYNYMTLWHEKKIFGHIPKV